MASRLDNLQVFPIMLFDWKKVGTKWTGVAEISDLGCCTPFNRLYEEKPDWGFAIQGETKKLIFAITKIVKDSRENEILHYVLTCIYDPNFEIILFND